MTMRVIIHKRIMPDAVFASGKIESAALASHKEKISFVSDDKTLAEVALKKTTPMRALLQAYEKKRKIS